jgi:hypothetical protein
MLATGFHKPGQNRITLDKWANVWTQLGFREKNGIRLEIE